jgi:hypothetical protein
MPSELPPSHTSILNTYPKEWREGEQRKGEEIGWREAGPLKGTIKSEETTVGLPEGCKPTEEGAVRKRALLIKMKMYFSAACLDKSTECIPYSLVRESRAQDPRCPFSDFLMVDRFLG